MEGEEAGGERALLFVDSAIAPAGKSSHYSFSMVGNGDCPRCIL